MTNGWGLDSRRKAGEIFHLEWEDFAGRHDAVLPDFEKGRMSLGAYLDYTIFFRPRPFSREEFTGFLYAQSEEYPECRAVLKELAGTRQYFVGALNNEALELNEYRIRRFHLREDFLAFFSSCYVGARKPEEAIYRAALQMTQKPPQECLFIDDREVNLETPRRLGLHTIHYQGPAQLRLELANHGVTLG